MVVGIIKKILPIAIIGIGLFAAANIVARPGQASMSAKALSETLTSFGGGVGSIGSGVQSLFTGIGTGSAQLLNPLFTLKDLIYGNSTQQIIQQENALTASNTVTVDPVVNTASDQPGVTPQAPATETGIPQAPQQLRLQLQGYQPDGTPYASNEDYRESLGLSRVYQGFGQTGSPPTLRTATSSEKSLLSSLTGGLLG
jgi:hypothetical protein